MNKHRITSLYTDWETIAVAIVLMATGLFLLGGDLFGILSLDRIQNLWPVALIVVGAIDLLSQGEEPRGIGTGKSKDTQCRTT